MKNILRAFALSLVVTGAVASAHMTTSPEQTLTARASAMPIPTCPPDGTTSCGIKGTGF